MQIDCPRCRRVLEYSGERPSFCAYCGSPLDLSGEVAGTTSVEPERTGAFPSQGLDETAEHQTTERAPAPPAPEEFPERIAGYRLLRKLGSGGMGTVFEAEDESSGQRVAIKLIGREHAASFEVAERFRQEGRLASAVTHPRCVFVLTVDEDRGWPYIVMELMPGTTLQTLVEREGPLRASSAIIKIFDVMEGLQQFHHRGLIHRDVKPSNCFLEAAGRVKIGDFGLSKALQGGMDLTRTGTFLGTPLYASPEQIKRDDVDERTDVYSVAATLYYLLCGQPPVQAKDAAEALARIASEPAPPLRGFRRDLPRALEGVILRGLERDPAKRWRTLQEFHDALVPFVPERLSIASVGLRVGAFLVDLGLSYLLSFAIFGVLVAYFAGGVMQALRFQAEHLYALGWLERVLWMLYFPLLEGLSGASAGKWLVGLRVVRTDRGGPPGIPLALLRFLIFYVFTELPGVVLAESSASFVTPWMFTRFWIYQGLIWGLGLLILSSTMREGSGFRGLHEWLSTTRVVRVAWRPALPTKRFRLLADSRHRSSQITPAPDRVLQIGPYKVMGSLRWDGTQGVVLGHDSTLDRPVWIVIRDASARPPSAARRGLNRRTRPRWISGGTQKEGRWDAFTVPPGAPLTEVVQAEGISWRDLQPILRDLAEELHEAVADGTMPRGLSPEQIWITSDTRIQLIDVLEGISDDGNQEPASGTEAKAPASTVSELPALAFLGEVARVALEGPRLNRPRGRGVARPEGSVRPLLGESDRSRWPSDRWGRPIRAAVPEFARHLLDRLTGVQVPHAALSELRADLELSMARPSEVTLIRRCAHLAIQGMLLLPGLFLMLFLGSTWIAPNRFSWELGVIVAIPVLWVAWAALSRGGVSLSLAGLSLVQNDGTPVRRTAAAWRAFLVWAPPTILLAIARSLQQQRYEFIELVQLLWACAIVLLLIEFALALLFPSRGPHDLLAGTTLVPL